MKRENEFVKSTIIRRSFRLSLILIFFTIFPLDSYYCVLNVIAFYQFMGWLQSVWLQCSGESEWVCIYSNITMCLKAFTPVIQGNITFWACLEVGLAPLRWRCLGQPIMNFLINYLQLFHSQVKITYLSCYFSLSKKLFKFYSFVMQLEAGVCIDPGLTYKLDLFLSVWIN